jgi:hypothetical protein
MLGISSLLALIGLLIILMSVILMVTRKKKSLAVASFIAGLLLIFVPSTVLYFLN